MKNWNWDGEKCSSCAFVGNCSEWRKRYSLGKFGDPYGCYVNIRDLRKMSDFIKALKVEKCSKK